MLSHLFVLGVCKINEPRASWPVLTNGTRRCWPPLCQHCGLSHFFFHNIPESSTRLCCAMTHQVQSCSSASSVVFLRSAASPVYWSSRKTSWLESVPVFMRQRRHSPIPAENFSVGSWWQSSSSSSVRGLIVQTSHCCFYDRCRCGSYLKCFCKSLRLIYFISCLFFYRMKRMKFCLSPTYWG